jgi:hypothetical protein
MSERVWKMSSVVMTAMVIGLVVGVADARADETVVANVPFAFTVGTMHFGPGNYTIKPASDDSTLMEIESADGATAMFAMTLPALADRNADQPGLVFTKIDGEYRLSRLVSADGNDREFIEPHQRGEREAAGAAR